MKIIFKSILEFWYILLVVFILGRFIYYPNKGKPEFLFKAWLAEYFLFRNKPEVKMIVYDNLELIRPDSHEQLKQDLQQRFGIPEIRSIKIGRVDTIKKSVRLMVTFKDSYGAHFSDD